MKWRSTFARMAPRSGLNPWRHHVQDGTAATKRHHLRCNNQRSTPSAGVWHSTSRSLGRCPGRNRQGAIRAGDSRYGVSPSRAPEVRATLLVRVGMPVLQQRDRRERIVQDRIDQTSPVGGHVVRPAAAIIVPLGPRYVEFLAVAPPGTPSAPPSVTIPSSGCPNSDTSLPAAPRCRCG